MRGDELVVEWGPSSGAAAKHTSRYPMRWLRDHCSSREARTQRAREAPRRSLWTAEFAASIPRFSCGDILAGGSAVPPESHFSPALRAALDSLWEFGVVIVTGTPLTAEGTREICEQFGVIERTFYSDAVWDTAPKDAADVNDTAYTNLALPPHTDCTYLTLPPALQAFNCVAQSAEGGCTRVVDGFQVAEHLRVNAPEAFRFFAETPLPFFCTEPGVSVRATHPVFSLDSDGKMSMFRYNNDDRGHMEGLTGPQIDEFYEHLPVLTDAVRSPDLVGLVRLGVGEMIIVHNHRVLHGREAFTGYRNLMGVYIAQPYFESQLRLSRQSDMPGFQ